MINKLIVPISILLAGGLIAVAIFLSSNTPSTSPSESAASVADVGHDPSEMIEIIDAIGVSGKILGDPNAPIIITEYSDTECRFCKIFHHTMIDIMRNYGPSGVVAWEFKHFPLAQLHRKAEREAQALECMLETGGDRAFWIGLDTIFTITPSGDGLDLNLLPAIAELAGADRDAFNTCLEEDRHNDIVQNDFNEARDAGGMGTPFSVIHIKDPLTEEKRNALTQLDDEIAPSQELFLINEEGTQISMSGALPYDAVEAMIITIVE